jgi:hypothetical protein
MEDPGRGSSAGQLIPLASHWGLGQTSLPQSASGALMPNMDKVAGVSSLGEPLLPAVRSCHPGFPCLGIFFPLPDGHGVTGLGRG